MDFGKILIRAWEIIWKFKALWIFGILASCGSNFSASGNWRMGRQDIGNLPPNFQRFFGNWERGFNQFFNEQNMGWIVAIVCIAILLGILLWVIGVFGKVGLIQGVVKAEAGAKSMGFRSLAGESWALLGKAVGLSILLILLPFAVTLVLVAVGAVLTAATLGIALICLIPLACVLVPIYLLYFVYSEMAIISLVKDGLSVGEALSRSWEIFRSQFGNLIAMGLILFLGGLLAGIVIAIPTAALFMPALFGFFSDNPDALGNGLLISVILFLIALPFLIVIHGILRAYIQSAWTLTYMHLTGAKPKAVKARART